MDTIDLAVAIPVPPAHHLSQAVNSVLPPMTQEQQSLVIIVKWTSIFLLIHVSLAQLILFHAHPATLLITLVIRAQMAPIEQILEVLAHPAII
jgi:hypothetical protein